jgi:lipopolysaccharide transport system permease protein
MVLVASLETNARAGVRRSLSMLGLVAAAWRFRQFIVSSVRSEFAGRFARSRLGGLWMILNPLAQAAILAFVLSSVLAAKLPGIDNRFAYALYLMAGTLAWSLFQETVNRCLTVFIDNGQLLKKLVFPRICLPMVVVGSALVTNLLLAVAVFLAFVLLGHVPGLHAAWLPLLIAITLAFGLGLGLVLGVLNVFIRDVGQVVPILLQFAFWLTPIIYVPSLIPEEYRGLLALNPMYPVVSAYQAVLVFGQAPDWTSLGWVALLAAALLGLALVLFRRASPEMVDLL